MRFLFFCVFEASIRSWALSHNVIAFIFEWRSLFQAPINVLCRFVAAFCSECHYCAGNKKCHARTITAIKHSSINQFTRKYSFLCKSFSNLNPPLNPFSEKKSSDLSSMVLWLSDTFFSLSYTQKQTPNHYDDKASQAKRT